MKQLAPPYQRIALLLALQSILVIMSVLALIAVPPAADAATPVCPAGKHPTSLTPYLLNRVDEGENLSPGPLDTIILRRGTTACIAGAAPYGQRWPSVVVVANGVTTLGRYLTLNGIKTPVASFSVYIR